MPTITTVDATWDTGVTLDSAELRRADSAMFLGDGTNNGVRGGVVYHGPTSLGVTVNGSDQVTVQAGAFVVPAATGLGVYRGSLGTATSAIALTARNATNPRIDIIAVQVGTGSGATVKTIDGTPSASPSAPALPAQHIELARVTVPATGGGAVTVDSSFRAYATTLGGTIYAPTLARLPGSGNITGQRAVALDTALEYTWSGSAWVQPGTWIAYTPQFVNWTLGTGGTVAGRYMVYGKTIHFRARAVLGTGFTVSGSPMLGAPVAFSTALVSTNSLFNGTLTDAGTTSYNAFASPGTSSAVALYVTGTNGAASAITATFPFTWVAGDQIEVFGTYESV